MFDSDSEIARRAFLGTTAGGLLGLSGCTSITDRLDDKTTKQNGSSGGTTTGTETTAKTKTKTKTETETETETARSRTEGTTATDESSLLYATDETTGYGIDLRGNPVIGAPDAPVDAYYWSDYQCPFCRKFARETLPKLVDDYARPGTVRIVVLDFPYLGAGSKTAARMAKCVWRQVRRESPDAFKRWHEAVFDAQGEENSGWASKKNLLDITEGVEGVDADAVDSCLRNRAKAVRSSVDDDVSAAKSHGIRGTPGFIFYDRDSDEARKLIGAQPYPLFERKIRKTKNA